LEPEIIFEFIESYGIDNGANVEKLLGILLRAKGLSPEISFLQFSEKFPDRPSLRVFATEISKCSVKEFSLKETPTASIKFAVRASLSIPMMFTPATDLSGNMFVDGGVVANFPFHCLTDSERESTIGITLFRKNFNKESTPKPITGILDYFKQLFISAYYNQNRQLYSEWSHRIIHIFSESNSPLHFELGNSEKDELMLLGRESAEKFLKTPFAKGRRRYSVS